jgi:Immunoglobulin domain/SprB repeat/Ig-like domain CHU_C associated/Secretion system C-terminal sorting domain
MNKLLLSLFRAVCFVIFLTPSVFGQTGSIGGRVVKDYQIAGFPEVGISGVTIVLKSTNNNTVAPYQVATALTDASGYFVFPNLAADFYILSPNNYNGFGWTFITPSPGVNLAAGQTVSNLKVGFYSPPPPQYLPISGKTFLDSQPNNVLNTGEIGLGGVKVYLDSVTSFYQGSYFGVRKDSTISDANGNFTFPNLPNNVSYLLFFAPPSGGYITVSANFQSSTTSYQSSTTRFTNIAIFKNFNCPNDTTVAVISGQTAVVNYPPPTGISGYCPSTVTTTTLISGLASGANFPIGVTPVKLRVTMPSCGPNTVCEFNVTVNPPICTPPTLTSQTTNTILDEGQTAAFNVTVTGSPTITYRWFKTTNPTATLGTTSTFSIPSVSLTDAGNYQCEISNACGTIISATAQLTVNPLCTTPPAPSVSNLTYCSESQAVPLTATGTNLLWYQGATGGTGSTIAPVPMTVSRGVTSYYVSQTVGTCESPRAEIQVLVNPNTIVITNQSADFDVTIGQTANFFVSVSGAAPLTYRWFKTDEPTVTLGTNATFTIPSVAYSDIGGYRCEITNDCDFVWSNVVALCTPLPAPYVGTPFAFAGCGNVGAKAQRRDANFAAIPNLTFEWYEYDANGPDNRGVFIQSQTTTEADPISFYNWNPAPTSTIQVKKVVVYENLNNCYSPKSEIELTVFPKPASDLTIAGLTTDCGQININAVPTTPLQSFQSIEWWKNGAHDVLPNLSVTPNFTTTDVALNFVFAFKTEFRPHVAGDLTCYSDPLFVDININPLPTVSITNLASNYCKNASPITLTGLPINGSFTIDGIAATILDPSVLSVGNHTVTYNFTDANGCSNSIGQTVTINALPTVSITNFNGSYCKNAPSVTLIGSPSGGSFTIDGIAATVLDPSVLSAGGHSIAYSVTVNGCSNSINLPFFINPLLITINNTALSPICPNETRTLVANAGFSPATYAWSTGATTPSVIVNAAGVYRVTATGGNCQSAISTFTIPDAVPPFTLLVDNPDCYRERGIITAVVDVATNYQFRRNGGSWQSSPIFSNLSAGNYVIDVRRVGLTCFRSLSANILAAPPRLTASVSKINITCSGANNGQIRAVNIMGGVTPYQFSLDSVQWQLDSVFTNLSAGIYKLFIRDANSCVLVKTNIEILDPSVLSLVLDSLTQIKCNGASTGRIYTTATGGTGSKMYSKNNGTTWQTSSDFTNLPSGTYNLLVKDANNCLSNAISTTLNEPSAIVFSTVKTNETCYEANDGTITVTASGGTGTLEYSRNNGSTYQISPIFTGLSAGNYAIKVRDANLCTTLSQTVNISQPTVLAFSTTVVNTLCNGSADGKITVRNYYGGNGAPYEFSKDNGGAYQPDSVFTGLSAGNYSIKIKDVNGCILTKNVAVTTPSVLTLVLDSLTQIKCNGAATGRIYTTATGGTGSKMYSKNNGTTWQSSSDFTNLPSGTYNLLVKDANNCISNAIATTLTEPSAISFSTAKTNETCNDANNGTITVTASGGVNPYEYSRNNGSTYQNSSIFTGLSAGNYAVKVRDANGCTTASQTVTLTQPLGFTFGTLTTMVTCNGDADAKITVRNYGGGNGSPYQFSKNNGANYQPDSVFTGLSAGNYFVKIRDVNGCESPVRNLTVTQPALITFATIESPVTCNFTSNGVIGITTVSGGTPQYKYARNGGTFQTSNAFTNLPVGVYPIQVKDSRGCLSAVANSTIVNDCPIQSLKTPPTPTQRIPIVIMKLSPNPTESEVNLQVNSLNRREQAFHFYDILGKQVQSETRTLEAGINRLSFDCYALPQGVYLILTPGSVGNNQQRKFIKL